TLAAVSGLPEPDLSAMIGRILPITAVIVPFWLVRVMVGWELTFEVLPAILVVGFSFGLTQFFCANHMDSNLVDIASGVVSIIVLVIFLKLWRPKRVWRDGQVITTSAKFTVRQISKEEAAVVARESVVDPPGDLKTASNPSRKESVMAWLPFLILSVIVLLWGLPTVKTAIHRYTTPAFQRRGWEF